jgi:hypothetical protein
MNAQSFLDGCVCLHPGDCLDALAALPPDSIDACVTDPPYGLGEAPDALAMLQAWMAGEPYEVAGKGFMGKAWDAFVPQPAHWKAVYRVLKPGSHVLAFFGTRTYDLGVLAMRLAGFEIRDGLQWMFGSGFPKGMNISKAIDKHFGATREAVGPDPYEARRNKTSNKFQDIYGAIDAQPSCPVTAAATPQAAEWEGWNTALKPAFEPIVLARKPLSESTVAANVLRWGTGALNTNGCRIAYEEGGTIASNPALRVRTGHALKGRAGGFNAGALEDRSDGVSQAGRWPANVIHDGSTEAVAAFPETGDSPPIGSMGGGSNKHSIYGDFAGQRHENGYGDSGSAARFFYSAKADAFDRMTSDHPTVKPVDLMQYLTRLVTPPGGTLLDPFAGTGTTGEAAWREGFKAILIERDPVYQEHIAKRMSLANVSDRERRTAVKAAKLAKGKIKPADLPLFGEVS